VQRQDANAATTVKIGKAARAQYLNNVVRTLDDSGGDVASEAAERRTRQLAQAMGLAEASQEAAMNTAQQAIAERLQRTESILAGPTLLAREMSLQQRRDTLQDVLATAEAQSQGIATAARQSREAHLLTVAERVAANQADFAFGDATGRREALEIVRAKTEQQQADRLAVALREKQHLHYLTQRQLAGQQRRVGSWKSSRGESRRKYAEQAVAAETEALHKTGAARAARVGLRQRAEEWTQAFEDSVTAQQHTAQQEREAAKGAIATAAEETAIKEAAVADRLRQDHRQAEEAAIAGFETHFDQAHSLLMEVAREEKLQMLAADAAQRQRDQQKDTVRQQQAAEAASRYAHAKAAAAREALQRHEQEQMELQAKAAAEKALNRRAATGSPSRSRRQQQSEVLLPLDDLSSSPRQQHLSRQPRADATLSASAPHEPEVEAGLLGDTRDQQLPNPGIVTAISISSSNTDESKL